MIQHYLQLLRQYRRTVLVLAVSLAVLAVVLSAVKLSVSPGFTASASIAVIPTDTEYTYGRDTSGGPRSATRGLTATYVEYLTSRPVVEAAFAKSGAGLLEGGKTKSADGWVVTFAKQLMGTASWIYHNLDSGRYVTLDAKEAALEKLMRAIDVQTVADSYIVRINVTLSDPKVAAAAANALAEAYMERYSEQLATSVGQVGGFLRDQIATREKEFEALRATEERLKSGVASSSLEGERDSIVRARETERQKLMDAQSQLDAAQADLNMLEKQDLLTSGRSLTELTTARSAASSRREAAVKNVELRQRTIRELDATLAALRQKEEPLLSVGRRLDMVKEDLTQLNARLLSTDLSRSTAMTQVRLIDPAIVPDYPSSPRVLVNGLVGLIAGLLLGLMWVVVADAVSEKVKTSVDLERVVGDRSLGRIGRSVVPSANGHFRFDPLELRRNLRTMGAGLERGLAMARAFDSQPIQVTGFLEASRVADVAATIGAALASRGRRVACWVPDGVPRQQRLAATVGDTLVLGLDEASETPHRGIRIKCLPPVSAELSFAAAAERSRSLVCVVPAGATSERDLETFQHRALEAGLTSLSFVLLDS